ncbi:MAG: LysE family transporter [Cytophagales bacterium]|nr:LysE family transporter [Cytophagales bacterium]
MIQTAIQQGFWAGFYMALGIVLSDACYVWVTFFGVSQLMDNARFKVYLGLVGGLILVVSGCSNFFKRVLRSAEESGALGTNPLRKVAKGFMLNGINPFVLIFWIGIVSMATVNFGYSSRQMVFFFIFMLSTVFLMDLLKSFLADKLSPFFTERLLRRMNIIIGICLLVFGIRLLYYAFEAWNGTV